VPRKLSDQLTAVHVRQIRRSGRYADGNGLYLVVSETGARWWQWRGTVQGRRRELGIGSVSYVSLKDARERARQWAGIAHDGGDPVAVRDRQKRALLGFEEAARRCWSERIDGKMRSAKHAADWLSAVERYAFPLIARKPIAGITCADVKSVLAPIWTEKAETARRVRQRLRTIFDWARASGYREDANPVEGVTDALPRQLDRRQHFAALPWKDMLALWPRLVGSPGMGALALRFAILTAARSGEVRGARWAEIDIDARCWTIPGERMKAGAEHRVPLSPAAIAILEEVRELGGDLVFPAPRGGQLSDMTLTAVLRRLAVPVTAHGFRSCFRDWAEDRTAYGHEIKEAALAHAVKNRTEAAYRRSDLFERRRALMADWAAFVTGGGDAQEGS
jgi:integrase